MKKRAEMSSREIFVIGLISLVLGLSFVFAAHDVYVSGTIAARLYVFNTVNESAVAQYNITINNTDTASAANITRVNITIPSSFRFVSNSNGTTTNVTTFINTSTYLSWINTDSLINGTTNRSFFWFNASGTVPGNFSINVTTLTSNGTNITSLYVFINDTTIPSSVSFVSPGLTANANLSQSSIPVNVSVVDNGAIQSFNITLINISSGLGINATNITSSNTSQFLNFTGIPNGSYWVNASVYDTFGNTNFSTLRFILDTILPTNIDFGTGVEVDYANLSQSHIYINITNATETNEKNITLSIYYKGNGTLARKITYNDSRRTINATGLPDSNYSYNVTICDVASNCNSTRTSRTITLDIIKPVITHSCDRLTVNTGESITCTCTATDATSGIKTGVTYTSHPATSTEGSFTTTCSGAVDFAGNNATTSTISYTVYSSSAAPGTGGGGSSITKTYIPSATQISAGYTNELKSNERVKLTIASQTHYVAVTALTATSTTISVSSTPQTATLNIGETKKFDVTGDGYYDLSTKLNGIKANKADITIRSIYEKIPAATQESTTTPAETAPKETTRLPEETPTNLTWLWIIIGVIVVLIVIWVIYKYKKK